MALGGAVWAAQFALGPLPQDLVDPGWLATAVESVRLSDEERHYEKILFSDDIVETRNLAKESGRPILMFSNDGPLGRC